MQANFPFFDKEKQAQNELTVCHFNTSMRSPVNKYEFVCAA